MNNRMSRRAFAASLSAMSLGLIGCSDAAKDIIDPPEPKPIDPDPPKPNNYNTSIEKAVGIADGLIASAQSTANGITWALEGDAARDPTAVYEGHAGILLYLAELHRFAPTNQLRTAIERGGSFLRAQPAMASPGLFTGNAGRAWTYLTLSESLRDDSWKQSALELAPAIANAKTEAPGDMLGGLPGLGLFLLRLYKSTNDQRWLFGARDMADSMLAQATPSNGGSKFHWFYLNDGRPVFYTGLSHGTAGSSYFLAKLLQELPASGASKYMDGLLSALAYLENIRIDRPTGVNWYRREPDQMEMTQIQWCHGAPGIGLLYTELHHLSGKSVYLDTALKCAATVDSDNASHWSVCQCHGLSGNAELYLKLYRETGDAAWLIKAQNYGQHIWSRRLQATKPEWESGSDVRGNSPSLWTGTAGIGWFYLQLAQDGKMGGPITE